MRKKRCPSSVAGMWPIRNSIALMWICGIVAAAICARFSKRVGIFFWRNPVLFLGPTNWIAIAGIRCVVQLSVSWNQVWKAFWQSIYGMIIVLAHFTFSLDAVAIKNWHPLMRWISRMSRESSTAMYRIKPENTILIRQIFHAFSVHRIILIVLQQ